MTDRISDERLAYLADPAQYSDLDMHADDVQIALRELQERRKGDHCSHCDYGHYCENCETWLEMKPESAP